jgi:hypothetical protein
MHLAAAAGKLAMLQHLVQAHQPVDATNRALWTPLHKASFAGFARVRASPSLGASSSGSRHATAPHARVPPSRPAWPGASLPSRSLPGR